MSWTLSWDGHEFTRADVKGAHTTAICGLLGEDTFTVDPVGFVSLQVVLAVCLAFGTGRALPEIVSELAHADVDVLQAALSFD